VVPGTGVYRFEPGHLNTGSPLAVAAEQYRRYCMSGSCRASPWLPVARRAVPARDPARPAAGRMIQLPAGPREALTWNPGRFVMLAEPFPPPEGADRLHVGSRCHRATRC